MHDLIEQSQNKWHSIGLRVRNLLVLMLTVFALFTLDLTHATPTDREQDRAERPACSQLWSAIATAYQRGTLGLVENPIAELTRRFESQLGPPVDGPGTVPRRIYDMEGEIGRLFDEAPEFRDLTQFLRRFGFTEEQALDVFTYYALHVWDNDIRVAGNPHQVIERLREVARAHDLTNPRQLDRLWRYLYYIHNITQLSVPEIATRLGIDERVVYREIQNYNLSILDEFERPLSSLAYQRVERYLQDANPDLLATLNSTMTLLAIAQSLERAGVSRMQVARLLGVGEQALSFIHHYDNFENRGVRWAREFDFEGRRMTETQILIHLFRQGFSSQEIANRLNQLAGTTARTDPSYRTQASVSAMIYSTRVRVLLGFSPPVPQNRGSLSGQQLRDFIIENYHRSDEWLAEQIGVTVSTLRNYFRRNHFIRLQTSASPASNRVANYARQRETVAEFTQGALRALADIAGFPSNSTNSNTHTAFASLIEHLPQSIRTSFIEWVRAQLPHWSGHQALQNSTVQANQVRQAWYQLIARHNEWAIEQAPERIINRQTLDLDSESGAREALYLLTERISLRDPAGNTRFSNLTVGGLSVLRLIEGLPSQRRGGNSISAFNTLVSHLPEQMRNTFSQWLSERLHPSAGSRALEGHEAPAHQVRDAWYKAVVIHNRWARENAPQRLIDLNRLDIDTAQGARMALYLLTGRISILEPEGTSVFRSLSDGALSVLRNIPGMRTNSRTSNTYTAIQSIISHLPTEVQQSLMERVRARVTKSTGVSAIGNQTDASASPLRDVWRFVIETHNSWAASHAPQRVIDLGRTNIDSAQGAREALYQLTQRISHLDPDGTTSFGSENGGWSLLQNIVGFGDASRTASTHTAFRSLLAHLPEEMLGESWQQIQTNIRNRAGMNASTNRADLAEVRDGWHWVVQLHNRWAELHAPDRVVDLETINLDTRSGTAHALLKITQRISLSDRDGNDTFSDLQNGALSIFRTQQGFRSHSNTANTHTFFERMIGHLPSHSRDELFDRITSHVGRSAGEKALQGRVRPMHEIRDGWHWLIQAHNEWAVNTAPARFIDTEQINIDSAQGVTQAMRLLTGAND